MIVTFDVTLCTVSIYSMIGISADRFLAVFRPASYNTTSLATTNTAILLTWLVGLAVSLPMYIDRPGFSNWHNMTHHLNMTACYPPNDGQSRGYSIYAAFMAFIIPITIIIVLYIAIAGKMRSISKKRLLRLSARVRQ